MNFSNFPNFLSLTNISSTSSSLMNLSSEIESNSSFFKMKSGDDDFIDEAYGKFYRNPSSIVDGFSYWSLVIAYTCASLFGFVGNTCIIIAVISNHKMRTARNVFILSLAIADSLQCIISMPFKLFEVNFIYFSLHC